MGLLNDMIIAFKDSFAQDAGTLAEILVFLLVTFFASVFEFLVYRLVSHRSMYNKSFHITIMIVPFFIGAIVMALQSNLVITLGTIGALAIIRFRTAVKDPVDMIYILWSVFIGIACGCKLYKLCVLVSLMVTLVLLLINVIVWRLVKNPYVLVVNCDNDMQKELDDIISKESKSFRLKSRNITSNGFDYVYQIETKDSDKLVKEVQNIEGIKRLSLLEFDNEDVM